MAGRWGARPLAAIRWRCYSWKKVYFGGELAMYKPPGSVPNWSLFRLAPLAFVLISAFASAQQQPSCVPNTANYPCVYVANGPSPTGVGSAVSVISASTNNVIGAVTVGGSV